MNLLQNRDELIRKALLESEDYENLQIRLQNCNHEHIISKYLLQTRTNLISQKFSTILDDLAFTTLGKYCSEQKTISYKAIKSFYEVLMYLN